MNRLRQYRFDNNLSIREMGKLIGISYSTVFNFETGKNMSERTIYYINKKLDDLLAKKEEE